MLSAFRASKEKRKQFAHVLAGAIILLHAYEKYESGHASHIWFWIFGIIFLTIAVLHHRISTSAPWIDGVFFVIE